MTEIFFGEDKYGMCKSCGRHSLNSVTLGKAEQSLKKQLEGQSISGKSMKELAKKVEQYVRSFCERCLQQFKELDVEEKAIAASLMKSSKYEWKYAGDMQKTVDEWEREHPKEAQDARKKTRKKHMMEGL